MNKKHKDMSRSLPDGLQDVQHLPDVASLGLQQVGQPAPVIGEAHVGHRLESNLDLGVGVSHCILYFRLWLCPCILARCILHFGQIGVDWGRGQGVLHWGLAGLLLLLHHQSPFFILAGSVALPLLILPSSGLLASLSVPCLGSFSLPGLSPVLPSSLQGGPHSLDDRLYAPGHTLTNLLSSLGSSSLRLLATLPLLLGPLGRALHLALHPGPQDPPHLPL